LKSPLNLAALAMSGIIMAYGINKENVPILNAFNNDIDDSTIRPVIGNTANRRRGSEEAETSIRRLQSAAFQRLQEDLVKKSHLLDRVACHWFPPSWRAAFRPVIASGAAGRQSIFLQRGRGSHGSYPRF
jgi:hypothetical protein